MSKRIFHLAVVGGGASGAIAIIQAHRKFGSELKITLLDPAQKIGLGRAYSTPNLVHLLNVAAPKMSVYSDEPNDFVDWVKLNHPDLIESEAYPFLPRKRFGEYVRERLGSIPAEAFEHLKTRAVSIDRLANEWKISTSDNGVLYADAVLVASGYKPQLNHSIVKPTSDLDLSTILQPDHYSEIAAIGPNEKVIVVGAGLTAVDVYLQLKNQVKHPVHFISRRGLLPLGNDGKKSTADALPNLVGSSPLKILKFYQSYVRNQGLPQDFADQIRSQVPQIWQSWNSEERATFYRHLKTYWDAARHRIPAIIRNRFKSDQNAQEIFLHAGRIQSASVEKGRKTLRFKNRKTGLAEELEFDKIILASGAEIASPPIRSSSNLKGLWKLGPTARSDFWEITAIPDISVQVGEILETIRHQVKAQSSPLNSMLSSMVDAEKSQALLRDLFEKLGPDLTEKHIKAALHESGVLWAWIPTWLGGLGLHPQSSFHFCFQLVQFSTGLTNIIGAHFAALGILSSSRKYAEIRNLVTQMKACTKDEPGILALAITEPEVGSDFESAENLKFARVMTQAKKVSGGFLISGQKIYVSNAPWAKWLVSSAYLDLKKPLESGILFLCEVKRAGITLGKTEKKLGQNLCPNAMVFYEDLRISQNEVFAEGDSKFSALVIEDSLGVGRASVAAMSMGVQSSMSEFGFAAPQPEMIEDFKNYFEQLPKSHLPYQNFPVVNLALETLVKLPRIGLFLSNAIDKTFESEKNFLGDQKLSLILETFEHASHLKASQAIAFQKAFENFLVQSNLDAMTSPFVHQQIRDARLFEIIEGTTEVCLKDSGTSHSGIAPGEVLQIENHQASWIEPEMEQMTDRLIASLNGRIDENHDWVRDFTSLSLRESAAVIYRWARENSILALSFYLKALRSQDSSVESVPLHQKFELVFSDLENLPKSFLPVKLLGLSNVYQKEIREDWVAGPLPQFLIPILMLGVGQKMREYAYDYSLVRVQGGKKIFDHPEVASLILQSDLILTELKEKLAESLDSGQSIHQQTLLPFFRLARNTAQVLGGMSYMQEHPISGLYLDLITLTKLSLQK